MKYNRFASKYLDVRVRAGDEVYALCPFHDDSKPSFAFNVSKGVFVCYACGERGTISKLLAHLRVEDVPSPTLNDLSTSIDLLNKPKTGERTYTEQWLKQFKLIPAAEGYLASRHLKPATVKEFQLGWDASREAITIPMHNRLGEIVGVNRRFMRGDTKYKYPMAFRRSENLYCYHRIEVRPRLVAVTEGCFDALAFWNIGIPAVSVFGSSMSPTQARLIRMLMPRLVVIASDMDDAGDALAETVSNRLVGLRTLRLPVGPPGTDPGDLTPPKLKAALRAAQSGSPAST